MLTDGKSSGLAAMRSTMPRKMQIRTPREIFSKESSKRLNS